MAEAKRDQNRTATLLAVSSSDGTTVVNVGTNPSNFSLKVSNGSSGSDLTGDDALREGNRVPVLLAVSSSDGITPVPVYADSDGKLLIKST